MVTYEEELHSALDELLELIAELGQQISGLNRYLDLLYTAFAGQAKKELNKQLLGKFKACYQYSGLLSASTQYELPVIASTSSLTSD